METKRLYKYTDSEVLYVDGKGVVLVIYDARQYGPHQLNDRWTVWFYEHQNIVNVQDVDTAYDRVDVGLCFGDQFCEEEIRQIETGQVWFTKC